MRLIYTFGFTVLLLCGFDLAAQNTPPTLPDTTKQADDPWATIDLTGRRMKLLPPAGVNPAVEPKRRGVPAWIPIGGGIIIGGVGTYLLLDGDDVPEPVPLPDSLLVRDDTYTVDCLTPITLRPLDNDEGSGLRITAIGPTGQATVELFGNDALIITELGAANAFSFTINVTDSLGNSATSDVFVTVEWPELTATDDFYATEFATPVNGNVLTNDQGENLRVVDFEPPAAGGNLTLGADGTLSFVPAADFVGTVSFTYTVEDDCAQRTTATVTIIVGEPDCELTLTLAASPTYCGLNEGAVTTSVSPAGDYTYHWSNGATTASLETVPAGEYDLTITGTNGLCVESGSATVEELPFTYLLAATPAAATCTGGGDLTLELAAPDDTPLVVILVGPTGTTELTLNPGITALGELLSLLPGNYTLSVYPQNAGADCAQQNAATIPDATPVFTVVDDEFATPFATPVSGNLLMNDGGLDLMVSGVAAPADGTVTHAADGTVTYTPPANFAGEVMFTYTAMDACGQTLTGTVTITVGNPTCDFAVNLTTTPANCGLADGTISAGVTPAGTYTYSWSDGTMEPTLTDLTAGDYQLTVTSFGGLCEESYLATVQELPGNYITDMTITPGTCLGDGNIELTLTNPASGPLDLTITGPAGTQNFNVAAGALSLDTLLPPITAGSYFVGVYPVAAGEECGQFVSLNVPDATPEPVAQNDAYTTPFATSVSGNVLMNDTGLQIALASTADLVGGTLEFTSEGAFTFTPAPNFTGLGGFTYLIEDACGNTAAAVVNIMVEAPDCEFSVNISTAAAHCGFADGGATVTVSPEDETYTYTWSNGGSTAAQTGLASGMYTVTVTGTGGLCSEAFSVFVPSLPIDYFVSLTSTPADCTGGGNILVDLNAPDGGTFNGVLTGPEFSQQITLPSGETAFDTLFNLVPGNYNLLVYPQAAGPSCLEEVQLIVQDTTPPLSAIGDMYVTPWQTPVSANVLTNDNGLDIRLTAVTAVTNGTLVFTPDGNFTFTPTGDFFGVAGFTYTVEDACGAAIQAQVNITVEGPDCGFVVTLTTVDAVCGLSTGSISTTIEPADDYDYLWSTGATTPAIESLAEGSYALTVTSNGGLCSQTFVDTIFMAEASFVDSLSTAPGDCAGNGSIILEAYAPDGGNLVVIINGPGGSSDLIIPSGFTDLGALVNLPSGVYDLVIYPESVGSGCSESTFAEVADNTPPFVPNDDDYVTGFQVTLVDNVLTNDEGLEVQAVEVVSSSGGSVALSSNGDFVFTPNDGFSGTATFVYSAMDACTEVLEASVTIEVGPPDCAFSATFTQTNASCGYNDGSVTPTLTPPGDQYAYLWSNGETTDNVENLFPGEHSVTITDTVANCPLSYTFLIQEDAADYLRNPIVSAPTCDQAGDVQFTLDGDPPGLHTLDITAPGGGSTSVPNLAGGTLVLSDYVTVVSGTYTLTAYNQNIGTGCTDTLVVVVPEVASPQIALVSIIQPSGPGATDGSFTVEITQPTSAPYAITLNGQVAGTTDGAAPFTLDNLGPGSYTVTVTDAGGCVSNTLNVELNSTLELRVGWAPAPSLRITQPGEPAVSRVFPLGFSGYRPYLRLVYRPRALTYALQISETIVHPDGTAPAGRLRAAFQVEGRGREHLRRWRWRTGPTWLAHPEVGLHWETTLQWAAPGRSDWAWNLTGGWGNRPWWGVGLIWERQH